MQSAPDHKEALVLAVVVEWLAFIVVSDCPPCFEQRTVRAVPEMGAVPFVAGFGSDFGRSAE
jgi:hypothetical protein